MKDMKLAVPDMISNSYFPAEAAVELGFFREEGLDVSLEMIFPVDKAYEALRDGKVDFVGGSAHSALAAFPQWQGVKLICAQAQGMYWFLVMHKDFAAKRGDIGSTAQHYAAEAFDRYGADAVTVNPYLGRDSVQPFLDRADKGVVILCHTSNPGAGDLQELVLANGGRRLYQHVAELVARDWNAHRNCALVVGATYPQELAQVRNIVGNDVALLIPGIGAQGGDVAAVVHNGKNAEGAGLIISSSRAILYAGQGADFANAARSATQSLRGEINRYR